MPDAAQSPACPECGGSGTWPHPRGTPEKPFHHRDCSVGAAQSIGEQVVSGWLDDSGSLSPDPDGITYRRSFGPWTVSSSAELRAEVERIISSYTLTMVGADADPYIAACADDVCAALLGWPVRYAAQIGWPEMTDESDCPPGTHWCDR